MRLKRLTALLMALTLSAVSLTACGSKDNSQNTASGETTTAASTAAGEKTAEKEPVKLKFLYYADGEQKRVVEEACANFTKQNPNIIVEPEAKPADQSYDALIATLVASDSLPDVSYIGESDVIRYYEKGMLLDISDMFEKGEMAPKLDSVTIKTPDGKIAAVGLSNQYVLLYYNKDLFRDAAIENPPTRLADAWSWDKFLEVAKKLTVDSNGKHPGEAGFNKDKIDTYGVHFGSLFQFFYMWTAYSNGGGIVSADGKKFLWDKPQTADAIQKVADLMNVHHVAASVGSSQVSTIGSVDQALLSKKVGMYITGSWDIANAGKAKREAGLNYGIGVLPSMGLPVTMNAGGPMAIYKSTKHPEEARKFFAYLADPNQVVDIIKSGAWMPNEKQWYTDPALLDKWVTSENFTEEAKTVITEYANSERGVVQWPAYYCAPWNRIVAISEPALDPVWAGKKSAADALKEIVPKIRPIFDSGKANE